LSEPVATGITNEELTGWAAVFADGRLARFVLVAFGVWMTALDSLVTATLMPTVGAELGGFAWFGWTVAGFMTGGVLACASAGRLSELFGLRLATVVAALIFALGCTLNAIAPNMPVFVVGRLVQGVGAGWISGFSMIAVALVFRPRDLARVFASMSGIWGVATLLGPLAGGVFAVSGTWRGLFWLFVLQALVFAGASWWLLRGVARPSARSGVPWQQLIVLALGIGAIGAANIASAPAVASVLVLGGCALIVLVFRLDATAEVRLMPHRAGDLTTVCGAGYAALFALTAASTAMMAYGPSILQELRGFSPLTAGYAVAAMALSWTLGAFAVAGAGGATERQWIRSGAACVLVGAILQAVVMRDARLVLVLPASILMGLGMGFSSSLLNRRILAALSDEDRAIGSSALIAARQAGGAVGAAIAGVAANFAGFNAGLTVATARTTAVSVFVSAIPLALAGAWAAWRMSAPRRH
jgi:MFS family permease